MSACAVAAVLASGVQAGTVYMDNTGDIFDTGFGHLDIVSLTITNDSTNVYFDIVLGGDLDATNWGKYALGIDTGNGPSQNGNAWGRSVDWGRGITHWVATWADDAGSGIGGQVWSFDGAGWNLDGGVDGDDSQHASGRQRFAVSMAALGLAVGDTFSFDLVSTGGSDLDPGVDHLSRSDLSTGGWGSGSLAGSFLTYAIVPLPPAAWAGVAMLGGLVGVRSLRRR